MKVKVIFDVQSVKMHFEPWKS